MTEAIWGDGMKAEAIEWKMSAALKNVPRGESDLAEVTSLERAVRAWSGLDVEHRVHAVLIPRGAGADSVEDSKSRENLILSER